MEKNYDIKRSHSFNRQLLLGQPNTFIPTLLHHFDAFFVEQFIFSLKIRFSFGYHFFIGAKSLSLEHSFQVCKQVVVAGSQIRRIRWNSKCNSCNFAIFAIDLSHTTWKYPFYCAETAPNSALNRRRVVIFYRLWVNAVPISNRAFSCLNVHTKWWIHYLLISSMWQLLYLTQL